MITIIKSTIHIDTYNYLKTSNSFKNLFITDSRIYENVEFRNCVNVYSSIIFPNTSISDTNIDYSVIYPNIHIIDQKYIENAIVFSNVLAGHLYFNKEKKMLYCGDIRVDDIDISENYGFMKEMIKRMMENYIFINNLQKCGYSKEFLTGLIMKDNHQFLPASNKNFIYIENEVIKKIG